MHGRISGTEFRNCTSYCSNIETTSTILDCLTLQNFLQSTIDPSSVHARFHLCTVDQAENVIKNEVAALAIGLELEGLGVVHRPLLLIDQKSTSDHDQDTTLLVGGLSVEGRDLVSNLGEWKAVQLLENGTSTLNRIGLKGEHRVITVEADKVGPGSVEGLVVELDELISDVLEVGHFEEIRTCVCVEKRSKDR
jgi:hypothetical protein